MKFCTRTREFNANTENSLEHNLSSHNFPKLWIILTLCGCCRVGEVGLVENLSYVTENIPEEQSFISLQKVLLKNAYMSIHNVGMAEYLDFNLIIC